MWGTELQQALGRIESRMNGFDNRFRELSGQVGNLQRGIQSVDDKAGAAMDGVGVIAGHVVANTRNKTRRCQLVADMQRAGMRVPNPQAAGCPAN